VCIRVGGKKNVSFDPISNNIRTNVSKIKS